MALWVWLAPFLRSVTTTSGKEAASGSDGLGDERFDNGRLHTGAEVAKFLRVVEDGRVLLQEIAHRRLQAGVAEVVVHFAQERAGEIVGGRIAFGGEAVQLRSAGIGQADELADFVETFAGSIIQCGTEDGMLQLLTNVDEHRVPAADNE